MMRLSSLFSGSGDPAFWDECERAHLLLARLSEQASGSPISRIMLAKANALISLRDKSYAPVISCYLYAAWSALSELVKARSEAGYEPDEYWLHGLESANKHIFLRTMMFLTKSDYAKVAELCIPIYNQVARTLSTGIYSNLDVEGLISARFSGLSEL